MEITDAYAHCGLRKFKPAEALREAMRLGGVSRTVLCQHRGEYDHHYIESLVRERRKTFTGVFLVDMESPRAMDEITYWAGRNYFRGIRMTAESLRDRRPLWDWAATLGLHFVVDGEIVPNLAPISQFAADHPANALIFTHMAQPRGGHEAFLTLAPRGNVCVQVSGMHSFGKPPYRELTPWISSLHKEFGAERLLYGSNFPVMAENSVYVEELELLKSGKLGVPERSIPAVMNGNALRIWFKGL